MRNLAHMLSRHVRQSAASRGLRERPATMLREIEVAHPTRFERVAFAFEAI